MTPQQEKLISQIRAPEAPWSPPLRALADVVIELAEDFAKSQARPPAEEWPLDDQAKREFLTAAFTVNPDAGAILTDVLANVDKALHTNPFSGLPTTSHEFSRGYRVGLYVTQGIVQSALLKVENAERKLRGEAQPPEEEHFTNGRGINADWVNYDAEELEKMAKPVNTETRVRARDRLAEILAKCRSTAVPGERVVKVHFENTLDHLLDELQHVYSEVYGYPLAFLERVKLGCEK